MLNFIKAVRNFEFLVKGVTMDPLDDKTILLTGGAKRPDEMQIVWSKTEVVRVISGKNRVSPPEKACSFKVIDGSDRGKVYPLEGKSQFCVGRSGADVSIKDSRVSKVHCMIEFYDGAVVIKDMTSTNGTLLNQFVLAEDFLRNGDRVQVGHTVLEFQSGK
jgi:hypothetical protein